MAEMIPTSDEERQNDFVPRSPISLFAGYNDPRRCGFLGLLYCGMDNPLGIWDKQCRGEGEIRRLRDIDGAHVLELFTSTNPETTFITAPRSPYSSLGIKLRWITFVIKSINPNVTLGIQVKDEFGTRRKFEITSNPHDIRASNSLIARLTLKLVGPSEWNYLQLDLVDLTRRVFGVTYLETVRVQVHPTCRIRMIYFSQIPIPIEEANRLLNGIFKRISNDVEENPEDVHRKAYLLVPVISPPTAPPAYVLSLDQFDEPIPEMWPETAIMQEDEKLQWDVKNTPLRRLPVLFPENVAVRKPSSKFSDVRS